MATTPHSSRRKSRRRTRGRAWKGAGRVLRALGRLVRGVLAAIVLAALLAGLGFEVELVNSGCCGMAGSFGYEAEHYDVSMQIGELALFPAVRQAPAAQHVVASGVSCRAQIASGTGREALHPVELIAGMIQ